MSNLQVLSNIIGKWKLNQTLLAEKMGMSKGNLCNKLSPNHYAKFSNDELDKLKDIMIELRTDLTEIDELDFNEALRVIVQREV